MRIRSKRKGFAIVLVAALAGLIFLLGASLVVVSRLQTAAAHYDQRVRLARENARLALDLALAELQENAGKDIAVSFNGDVLSEANSDDFKGTRTGAVLQPFWTGVSQGGSTSWLVTRPLEGTLVTPDVTHSRPSVVLLGAGTVGDNDKLKVSVPTESIEVEGVDGFQATESKLIGNYGYWVGDLGVKGSYAWYDQVDRVVHSPYVLDPDRVPPEPGGEDSYSFPALDGDETFVSQHRLRQMSIAKPRINYVDTNDGANPMRIDSFLSDFQFRDDFGDTSTSDLQDDRYIVNLEQADVEDYFHDFTPLSKGLMVDSQRGGFKHDLSLDDTVAGFQSYAYYSRAGDSNFSIEDGYDSQRFRIEELYPEILPTLPPAIVQFSLNYSVSLSAASDGEQLLKISYQADVEFWNPFSSEMDFEGGSWVLSVFGLPTLSILDDDEGGEILSQPLGLVQFEVSKFSADPMRAGEIVLLSGPQATGGGGVDSLYLLGEGAISPAVLFEDTISSSEEITSLNMSFDSTPSNLGVQLSLLDAGGVEIVSSLIGLGGGSIYTLENKSFDEILNSAARFGFSWKIRDDKLPLGQGYNPLVPNLSADTLDGWVSDSTAEVNYGPTFFSGASSLLGFNGTGGESLDTGYDVPAILLPKQKLVNVGQLSAAISTGSSENSLSLGQIGDDNNNEFFDKYFFSSIPSDSLGWSYENRIPNAFYVPKSGLTIPDLAVSNGSAAESLFVHGMFNVHSTSIDAWTAILKGSPVSEHPYWADIFDSASFLFMNHPLGGEDINILDPDPAPAAESIEAVRASLKKNAFALTATEVETLAGLVVKEIRTYVQGTDGPFNSLEEFVNAGILQKAIDAMDINPDWVVAGTPAEFRQSTILNLISGILSVRSDTFLVRAYGDAVDPADPSKIWAKAYCEAIIQRTHEEYGDVASATLEIDRKFEVVAFRWLAPSEI